MLTRIINMSPRT